MKRLALLLAALVAAPSFADLPQIMEDKIHSYVSKVPDTKKYYIQCQINNNTVWFAPDSYYSSRHGGYYILEYDDGVEFRVPVQHCFVFDNDHKK